MANRRYSDLRGSPSSKTTMLATTSVPCRLEMSNDSIRSGGSARPRASESSDSARLRAEMSLARRMRCRANACLALCSTVSIRVRLSPRRGTRRSTRPPRAMPSRSATTSVSGGSCGTSTSRGISFVTPVPTRPAPADGALAPALAGEAPVLSERYSWVRNCSTSSPVVRSSILSTTQPRWPRTRPSRT